MSFFAHFSVSCRIGVLSSASLSLLPAFLPSCLPDMEFPPWQEISRALWVASNTEFTREHIGLTLNHWVLGKIHDAGIDDCELWLRISKTLSDRWIHCRSTLQVVQSVGLSFWADLLWMAKYQMLTSSRFLCDDHLLHL